MENHGKSAAASIADLDLRVKAWAVSSADKLGIKGAKKAKVEVNWDRVTFTPSQPEWREQRGVPQPHSNRVVYSSTFTNRTGVNAEHTIKVLVELKSNQINT
jgi:hypothetical protein